MASTRRKARVRLSCSSKALGWRMQHADLRVAHAAY